MCINNNELDNFFLGTERLLIYGAGIVAYNIMKAVERIYSIRPDTFVVSEKSETNKVIENIPVISESELYDWNCLVIVAVPEIYHEQINQCLSQKKCKKVLWVDTHIEYCLMSRYFMGEDNVKLVSQLQNNQEADRYYGDNLDKIDRSISVYMAKSHKDKPLLRQYNNPSWIIPIQAGADCTTVSLNIQSDNYKDNISYKNPNYCELTVTYWVWKNIRKKYKGICHYRRTLDLHPDELRKCITNDVDIILPLPFVCYPNATGQYGRYISHADRDCLFKAVKEISPEYSEVFVKLDNNPYFYNYNILIAKEEIFDDYAEWLFNVLERTERYCEPEGITRRDRYAGYLGELLTTLYILKHREEMKIVHAEKKWFL